MFYVSKRMEIAGAHMLHLDYESKCSQLHGHNWIVTVHCKCGALDQNGMVADFTRIKKEVQDRFDHKYLNEVAPFEAVNPTAENMALFICEKLQSLGYDCYKVEVQESEGNVATYVDDSIGGCTCK